MTAEKKAVEFIRRWTGVAELASHPSTQHLYDKYQLLVEFEAEGKALLAEMATRVMS